MSEPKILLIDIETAPAIVYSWGLYDQNIGINQIVRDGYLLSWAAKWYGSKEILFDSLVEYPKVYKADPTNDEKITKSMWKLMDEADLIIGHCGDSFDIKHMNTAFLKHNLPPVSSFRSIDTKKEAKKHFRFMSNKLEFIATKLDLGHKIQTGGFELWQGCMDGDKEAWEKMVTYNKHDVILLEKVYNKLKPFMKNHPAFGSERKCNNCGSERFISKGQVHTNAGSYQRLVCVGCGASKKMGPNLSKRSISNA